MFFPIVPLFIFRKLPKFIKFFKRLTGFFPLILLLLLLLLGFLLLLFIICGLYYSAFSRLLINMIYLYSGTPGSGKSLYATYLLITKLKFGKNVIANFQIDTSYFKKTVNFTFCDNSDLTVKFLVDFAHNHHIPNKEDQTYLIIDEASVKFNSRDWNDKDRKNWLKFFAQHRKLGFDVILISQNDRMLDRQIRSQIETEFKFRAIKNYKFFGGLLNVLFGGLFVKVEYWYPVKLKCGSEYFTFNKRKAKIYDTFKIFE